MDAQFFCPLCEAKWDLRAVDALSVANVGSLFDGLHRGCRANDAARAAIPMPDATPVEPLDWTLNLTNGRLIGSHAAADASLPLYQVWHDGDHWIGATMHEPLTAGLLVECLDACQEHFSDARAKDAEAVR